MRADGRRDLRRFLARIRAAVSCCISGLNRADQLCNRASAERTAIFVAAFEADPDRRVAVERRRRGRVLVAVCPVLRKISRNHGRLAAFATGPGARVSEKIRPIREGVRHAQDKAKRWPAHHDIEVRTVAVARVPPWNTRVCLSGSLASF